MIFDRIDNKESYRSLGRIYLALDWASKQTSLPGGRTELLGDEIFASPNEFITRPASEIEFEAHEKYIDLHFILDGVEGISVAPVDTLTKTAPYVKERDILFLNGEETSTSWLSKGYFMVCFPHDAHRPGMQRDNCEASANVKKIIIKIKA